MNLFSEQGRLLEIQEFKTNLVSRFRPMNAQDVLQGRDSLNFDRYHLMLNESIEWNLDLLEKVNDLLDWTAIGKLRNIRFDAQFFNQFGFGINIRQIQNSSLIVDFEDFLVRYSEKIDWENAFPWNRDFDRLPYLRRFKGKANWGHISRWANFLTDEIIEEFEESWDWEKLSSNPALPVSISFLERYGDRLSFPNLSANPACISLIQQYPDSRWSWGHVVANPAVVYTDDVFDFYFEHFKRHLTLASVQASNPLLFFLSSIALRQQNNMSYFFSTKFRNIFPWDVLCQNGRTEMELTDIERLKDKLTFTERAFVRAQASVFTTEFIIRNQELFNWQGTEMSALPLTRQLVESHRNEIDWNSLSNCTRLDWTWDFIDENWERLNPFLLSQNRGVYESLV
jgi:hypothetical protein